MQALLGVVAHRFEHAEAPVAPPHEALLDERGQLFDVCPAYRLRRLEREPAGEDAEPAEERLLAPRAEVVTPLDRCPKRPVAFGGVRGAGGEQLQPLSEPFA